MKHRKYTVMLLTALLAAVIAGGIWYFASSGGQTPSATPDTEEADLPPAPAPGNTVLLSADISPKEQGMYYANGTDICVESALSTPSARVFLYKEQPAVFQLDQTAGMRLRIIALRDGQILKEYQLDSYDWAVSTWPQDYCLNEKDQLCVLTSWDTGDNTAQLYILSDDGQEVSQIQLTDMPFDYYKHDFRVCGDYVLLAGSTETRDVFGIYHMAEGSWQTLPIADNWYRSFCLDDQNALYYFERSEEQRAFLITKKSLETGEVLWSVPPPDKKDRFQKLWRLPGVGIFCLSLIGYNNAGIYLLDEATGEIAYMLMDISVDTSIDPGTDFADRFAVDPEGGVYFVKLTDDFSYEAHFVPLRERTVSPENAVTLTITAPHPVESIEGAIQKYQRKHPEVTVVWDTPYATRDDYILHGEQYREQIAMRTMSGDVGDLQMALGGGLAQEAVTQTDAFEDLSPYLEACPFKDELSKPMLEGMRGEDGAIRALPIGLSFNFFVYNQNLADELGLDWDVNHLTWSQLLDLAKRWEEEDAPYSLFTPNSNFDVLWNTMIQANVYSFELPDGRVDVGQPWMRDLLEAFKSVKGSPQFISQRKLSADQRFYFSEGYFDNCLFSHVQGNSSYDMELPHLFLAREERGLTLRMIPVPSGETLEGRVSQAFVWGIPASSEQKEEAWELLEFIISSEGLPGNEYSFATFSLNDTVEEKRFESLRPGKRQTDPFYENIYQQIWTIRHSPVISFGLPAEWLGVRDPLKAYMNGSRSLDEALALASENWERFLRE